MSPYSFQYRITHSFISDLYSNISTSLGTYRKQYIMCTCIMYWVRRSVEPFSLKKIEIILRSLVERLVEPSIRAI